MVDPSGNRPCSDDPNFSECEKGLPHADKNDQKDPVPEDPLHPEKFNDIRILYLKYKYTKGWWNDNGYGSAYFTELDFLRLILSYELSPISSSTNPKNLEMLSHGTTHWFYSRCETVSKGACPGITPNAIFNFLIGSQSVQGKIDASKAGINISIVTKASESRMSVASLVVNGIQNPMDVEWFNGGSGYTQNSIPPNHPVWWGNESKLLEIYHFIPSNIIWKIPGFDPWYLIPAVPIP